MKTMRNIVVFDEALVVVRGTDYSSRGMGSGGGSPVISAISARDAKKRVERNASVSPDELVNKHKVNFAIRPDEVTAAVLTKSGLLRTNRRLRLELSGDTKKFKYPRSAGKDEVVIPALKACLGDKFQAAWSPL